MRKALVTLVKRHVIDNKTEDRIFKDILDNSFAEIGYMLTAYQITNYSVSVHGHNEQLKKSLDDAATLRSMNSVFKLNGYIPGLWDSSHRHNLRILIEPKALPSVKVEVIELHREEKEKLQLAVYFETEHLILLDSIGDKLLLAFSNTTGQDDSTQKYFTETFFLKLTDDIYFSDYKIL